MLGLGTARKPSYKSGLHLSSLFPRVRVSRDGPPNGIPLVTPWQYWPPGGESLTRGWRCGPRTTRNTASLQQPSVVGGSAMPGGIKGRQPARVAPAEKQSPPGKLLETRRLAAEVPCSPSFCFLIKIEGSTAEIA
ncbi:hypothetical protein RRG08_060685 [Elysia crispata]|uniref:Uncharacterized protein n=1 Tax=Elysia crispata TaxID=231223 RepID=A0AAE0YS03_9GAST|nr:hypothetical protein RRG08_060685 [Elysia crispata]